MAEHERIERSILITGATGFLGGALLGRLLENDRRNVVCIVRAESDEAAAARGREAMKKALGRRPSALEERRTTWLRGDVEQADLGLSPQRYGHLVRCVHEIFHCAATTRFDLPLAEARRANLASTRSVLTLANGAMRYGSFRRFHHVSTAYVAGDFRGSRGAAIVAPEQTSFRNTYERTKAEAEVYLRENIEAPMTIYRPSIIVGDSLTGRTSSWNVVYYPMKLMAAGVLKLVPGHRSGLLDCVPIDYVVDAMLALADRDDTDGEIFHLTAGRNAMTCREVIEHTYAGIAAARGHAVRVGTALVSRPVWFFLEKALRRFGAAQAKNVLDKFEQYAPYTRIHGVLDNSRETRLLGSLGVTLPDRDRTFARAVAYALESNFGRRGADEADRTFAKEDSAKEDSAREKPRVVHRLADTRRASMEAAS